MILLVQIKLIPIANDFQISLGIEEKIGYYFNMTLEEGRTFITNSFDCLIRNKFDGLHMKYM